MFFLAGRLPPVLRCLTDGIGLGSASAFWVFSLDGVEISWVNRDVLRAVIPSGLVSADVDRW